MLTRPKVALVIDVILGSSCATPSNRQHCTVGVPTARAQSGRAMLATRPAVATGHQTPTCPDTACQISVETWGAGRSAASGESGLCRPQDRRSRSQETHRRDPSKLRAKTQLPKDSGQGPSVASTPFLASGITIYGLAKLVFHTDDSVGENLTDLSREARAPNPSLIRISFFVRSMRPQVRMKVSVTMNCSTR